MSGKMLFSTKDKMGILTDDGQIYYLESEYAEQYNRNKQSIRDRNEWKSTGTGAKFMGVEPRFSQDHALHTSTNITGLCCSEQEEQYIYAIQVDDSFGIFKKSMNQGDAGEGHIFHTNQLRFFHMDYSKAQKKIILSLGRNNLGKHLALLDPETSRYQLITEGDAIDEHPVWSKTEADTIFYDSCGIGFDESGAPLGVSECVINKLCLTTGMIQEQVFIRDYDCIKPHETTKGELYFIKRPKEKRDQRSGLERAIETTLMLPINMAKAVSTFAQIAKMRKDPSSAGRMIQKTSKGSNLFSVEGHVLNAEENEINNQKQGERFAGIMPRNWQLVKKDEKGMIHVIKKGVLDFDIDEAGNIFYSNGKYLIKLLPDGKEEKLAEVALGSNLKILS